MIDHGRDCTGMPCTCRPPDFVTDTVAWVQWALCQPIPPWRKHILEQLTHKGTFADRTKKP